MTELYVGLAGLPLDQDEFDLGERIVIRKTYAHLMMPIVMAFKPALAGQPHPAPWRAVQGGGGHDIIAELRVKDAQMGDLERCHVYASVLRLWSNPATTMIVTSTRSLADFVESYDETFQLIPMQVQERLHPYGVEGGSLNEIGAAYVKSYAPVAYKLWKESAEFKLALDALNSSQYQQNTALILVSLWAAFEALFLGDRSELRFRVSSYMASYLEKYGPERAKRQKRIAELYDKRSAAVHGLPTHNSDDVVATLNLMRDVLMMILTGGAIPTREELQKELLG